MILCYDEILTSHNLIFISEIIKIRNYYSAKNVFEGILIEGDNKYNLLIIFNFIAFNFIRISSLIKIIPYIVFIKKLPPPIIKRREKMKRKRNFFKVSVVLLALAICFFMQKNVSAQNLINPINLWFSPFNPTVLTFNPIFDPFLPGLPIARTASVLTTTTGGGGGAAAAVIGIWNGTWLSLVKFNGGLLNLILNQDPLTGQIIGTASFILNKLLPIPVNVTGTFLLGTTTVLELTGAYFDILSGTLYTLNMTCNILAPGVMDGTYSIISIKSIDYGTFNATL